jgi:hypothetical protein
MASCPVCGTRGAYIGLIAIECRNPECRHFVPAEVPPCPRCGKICPEPCSCGELSIDIDGDETLEGNSSADDPVQTDSTQ